MSFFHRNMAQIVVTTDSNCKSSDRLWGWMLKRSTTQMRPDDVYCRDSQRLDDMYRCDGIFSVQRRNA